MRMSAVWPEAGNDNKSVQKQHRFSAGRPEQPRPESGGSVVLGDGPAYVCKDLAIFQLLL